MVDIAKTVKTYMKEETKVTAKDPKPRDKQEKSRLQGLRGKAIYGQHLGQTGEFQKGGNG